MNKFLYCVENGWEGRLTRGRIYEITSKSIDGYPGYYRVKRDDTGKPMLYSEEVFSELDPFDYDKNGNKLHE